MKRRFYFAITNCCNRTCELCSCYSSPERQTFLPLEYFKSYIPDQGSFEIQLEGGEPLLHPDLNNMITYVRNTGRCENVILGTNSSLLPFVFTNNQPDREKSIVSLKNYFLNLGEPFLLKPSLNYYLYKADKYLFEKADIIAQTFSLLSAYGDYKLIFNVRRRKSPLSNDNDSWLLEKIEKLSLIDKSNIFYFQRYGQATNRPELELPFIVENPLIFYLISPDGRNWNTDLIARSNAMKELK
ncbi:MAG: hypothetical protein AB1782_00860 [Cyanobacteriota bacterium]